MAEKQMKRTTKSIRSALVVFSSAASALALGLSGYLFLTRQGCRGLRANHGSGRRATIGLGIEVWQDGNWQELQVAKDRGDYPVYHAMLRNAPFELRLLRTLPDPHFRIIFRDTPVIFNSVATGMEVTKIPDLCDPCALADYAFSEAIYISEGAYSAYDKERLRPLNNNYWELRFSWLWQNDQEMPLSAYKGPLYLFVYEDHNQNGKIDVEEYSLIVLEMCGLSSTARVLLNSASGLGRNTAAVHALDREEKLATNGKEKLKAPQMVQSEGQQPQGPVQTINENQGTVQR